MANQETPHLVALRLGALGRLSHSRYQFGYDERVSIKKAVCKRRERRMGNCCGSQSALDDDDNGPAQPRPAASRPSKPRKPTGPGHTLGGPPADTSGGVDPRTAAAIAAQVQEVSR